MVTEIELRRIDHHFADFICTLKHATITQSLHIAASLVSHAVGNGNICIAIAEFCDQEFFINGESVHLPKFSVVEGELRGSGVVGFPGEWAPLILDCSGRLYLYRYWHYEHQLANAILNRGKQALLPIDEMQCSEGFQRLFKHDADNVNDKNKSGSEPDWQQVAALSSLSRRFCIISGGPGTGKTSTVVKILALALEISGNRMSIALAAPTGKSASRLKESIVRMKESLNCAQKIKEAIPCDVSTLHRLLGSISDGRRFRYNETNHLPHDMVIVDEASMVPLPLMSKLMDALKPDARLILLGDRDQLASVEAGAVMGDICSQSGAELFSQSFAERCEQILRMVLPRETVFAVAPALADSLIILSRSYRFSVESGIGKLAACINSGDGISALELLCNQSFSNVSWHDLAPPEQFLKSLRDHILNGYSPYLRADTPEAALLLFDRFRILCAVRSGEYGVDAINRLVEEILGHNNLIDTTELWYKGRPVIITVNDYALKLYNGDIGIAWSDNNDRKNLKVYFPMEGGVRVLSPVRIPAHETVYAMTVHKSQGSEFNQVEVILPDHDSPVITRELIYTGITRAKETVGIWGKKELFITAVNRKVQRVSGLVDTIRTLS